MMRLGVLVFAVVTVLSGFVVAAPVSAAPPAELILHQAAGTGWIVCTAKPDNPHPSTGAGGKYVIAKIRIACTGTSDYPQGSHLTIFGILTGPFGSFPETNLKSYDVRPGFKTTMYVPEHPSHFTTSDSYVIGGWGVLSGPAFPYVWPSVLPQRTAFVGMGS